MPKELSWSAFLRQPTRVEPLLKKGSVVLRRRDSKALRISRADEDDAVRAALAAAARLLAGTWHEERRPPLEQRVEEQLPWTRFLPPADRHAFAVAFLREFEACADLGDFSSLGRLLDEWRHTARLHADGLGDELKRPLPGIGERVGRPKR